MAITKPSSSSSKNEKGVAFEKRARMDKTQQEILMICCLASAIIGFTLVGATFLIRKISYNKRVISAYDTVIDTYKDIQKSLISIEGQISGLTSNENLESVGRKRDSDACRNYAATEGLHGIKADELELVKTCSSLRVISDAMPSKKNMEATLSSLNQLLNWANNKEGVRFEGLSAMQGSVLSSQGFKKVTNANNKKNANNTIHVMNSSLKMIDSPTAIKSALAMIESSVRNFDIVQAQISFNGDQEIELSTTFGAYYSDPAALSTQDRVVCADVESEKCKSAGGDTADKEKKAAENSGKGKKSTGDKK